jgi:hypothetical protein
MSDINDEKIKAVLRKIEALLNTNGCTEAEAQARTAKAQELLEAYNLDMAEIGASGKGAQRSDTKRSGGLYGWQRKLWKAVAELNFCYYFSIKGLARGSVYEHRLVGFHANVVSTEMMAKYLQETVERLAQKWAKENGYKSVFVREAIAVREGMTARLSERLQERRNEQIRKAEEAKRDRERNATASTSNALTIVDIVSSEADFNNDYLNNWEMGTTARKRHEDEVWRKKYWADYQEKMRKQAEWDAANPEAAAKRKAEEAARNEKWRREEERKAARRKGTSRYRRLTPEEERMGLGSYYEGRSMGAEIGLDTQVDASERRKIA